ncbi:titin-like isoform X3 [Corticium candelabrum]|uniref:titin-like isoform X3 n=1 Tax=Corticium candelabrum TaxID=121492 RepID=UPI002E265861|nr:titin-like isoform X3 [Corticium candelabrum]
MPEPTLNWTFTNNDGHMETLQEQPRLPSARASFVRVSSISRDKSGRYDCVLENEFDKVTSSAHLTVQYFDGVSLSVIPSNELVFKELGTLVINVSSVPAATEIRLSRNNVVFFSSSNGNLNKSIGTVIVNESNYIQYIFTVDKSWNTTVTAYAKHLLGSNTSTQVITVLAPPGPIDVSVNTSCYNNNNSLLVMWTVYSNGGRDISNYTLRWRKDCSNTPTTLLNSKTWMVSNNARFTQQGGSYIIPGLDGNTTYCIDVEATNSIGPMSTTVKATTLSVPNQPKLQCNPTLTTNTSVAIAWVVSSNGGDDVSHYAVVLSEDVNFTQTAYSKTLFVVDNSELTQKGGMVTVPGLSGGTTYYAKVVARNCVGASVPATQPCSTRCSQCICPLLQPRAVKEVFLSDDTITLTVKAPDLNCQIDKYIVKDVASADELQSSYSVENGIVTITITGLAAGANYTVQVYAVDQSQERPIGKPVTFQISSQDKGRESVYQR